MLVLVLWHQGALSRSARKRSATPATLRSWRPRRHSRRAPAGARRAGERACAHGRMQRPPSGCPYAASASGAAPGSYAIASARRIGLVGQPTVETSRTVTAWARGVGVVPPCTSSRGAGRRVRTTRPELRDDFDARTPVSRGTAPPPTPRAYPRFTWNGAVCQRHAPRRTHPLPSNGRRPYRRPSLPRAPAGSALGGCGSRSKRCDVTACAGGVGVLLLCSSSRGAARLARTVGPQAARRRSTRVPSFYVERRRL